MNEQSIVREIKAARMLLGFGNEWSKGYSIGEKAGMELDYGIGPAVYVAVYLAEKSGVPEIKRLKGPIERTEPKDNLGGFGDPLSVSVAKSVLRKVKRLGPMGILGAMAGVTEDVNAHKAAGLAYALSEQMEKKVAKTAAKKTRVDMERLEDAVNVISATLGEVQNGPKGRLNRQAWKLLSSALHDLENAERILGKQIAEEKAREGSSRVAGDEWVDKETEAFAKDLAKVMSSDSDIATARAKGNRVEFVHSPSPLITVPLVLEVKEFGYGGESESVNGMIFSEEVRNFRIPGGYTRKRDPRELWKHAKGTLEDIMRRAM